MLRTFLRTVDSYADTARLQAVVAEALAHDAAIAAMLAEGAPRRLVVVKPNWVQEAHEYNPAVWEPVITHPTLVEAVVEELARAMKGVGTIAVCDAPHTYASFDAIVGRGQLRDRLDDVRRRWPGITLEIIDLRREVWIRREEVVVERRPNPHDPRGYVAFNLGRDSLFYQFAGERRYYGADYDSQIVNEHHIGERQEYLLAGTPVACDLFVNLPKLKTHKKTGITCCLKNLVGINGDKNWLPHHTEGSPNSGGDEFPSEGTAQWLERTLKHAGRNLMQRVPGLGNWVYRKLRNTGKAVLGDSESTVRNGNWSGNDTCWRMALDLNRALLYGNSDGTWRDAARPKHYLAIVDGVIGGEGNGPLCPDPVSSRCLVFGNNPAAVDATAARLMGFDPEDLPIVANAFGTHRWPICAAQLGDVEVDDDRRANAVSLRALRPVVPEGFKPHFGWQRLAECRSRERMPA